MSGAAWWPGRPVHPRALEELAAVQHFADPALYDATYRRRTHDVAYYQGLAGTAGRVLELGAGSGRITWPMARAGAQVTAVDRSVVMLEALRSAGAAEPAEVQQRVRTLVGDLRSVDTTERFPLVVCPFNTFLHLYTRDDVARALTAVRRALAPGGRFVFDTSLPRPGDLRDRTARGRRVQLGTRRFAYTEVFSWEPLEQILYVTMTWTPLDGGTPFRQLLAHRQFFAAELEALLHQHGFAVEAATEWGAPLSRDPDAVVWTCLSG